MKTVFINTLVVAGVVASPLARAATWEFQSGVELIGTYSDNVFLAADGQEQGDFIVEANPFISLLGRSTSLQLELDYRLQNIFYNKNDDRNDSFHQLDFVSTTELLEETLFLGFDANVSQSIIDPEGDIGAGNLVITNNRTDVVRYQVEPAWRQRFGDFYLSELSYTYDDIDYRDDALIDSKQGRVNYTLSNKAKRRGLTWEASYSQRDVDYENNDEAQFEEAKLELAYFISSRTEVFANSGNEKDDFLVNGVRSEIDDSFWNTGLRWRGNRDEIMFAYGERFFGNTFSFDWQHRGSRIELGLSYDETLNTNSILESERRRSTTQLPNDADLGLNTNITDAFVQKRSEAKFSYKKSRLTIATNLYYDEREFQIANTKEKTKGGLVNFIWQFSPRTNYTLGLRYESLELPNANRDSDYTRYTVSALRRLSRSLDGVIRFAHQKRSISDGSNNYDENSLSLQVTKHFR